MNFIIPRLYVNYASKNIDEKSPNNDYTVKLSNFNKFSNRTEPNRIEPNRTEPNSVELIRFCHGEPYPNFYEFFDYFCVFLYKVRFGSVRSNRIDQFNIIQYLHGLNASYSVNFEVRFDRTEPNFLKKKHKNNKKVRVRFAVTNSYLIRFGSVRFGSTNAKPSIVSLYDECSFIILIIIIALKSYNFFNFIYVHYCK
jgi:hypothetical protein